MLSLVHSLAHLIPRYFGISFQILHGKGDKSSVRGEKKPTN